MRLVSTAYITDERRLPRGLAQDDCCNYIHWKEAWMVCVSETPKCYWQRNLSATCNRRIREPAKNLIILLHCKHMIQLLGMLLTTIKS